jgi:hypothetical protein
VTAVFVKQRTIKAKSQDHACMAEEIEACEESLSNRQGHGLRRCDGYSAVSQQGKNLSNCRTHMSGKWAVDLMRG